MSWKEVRTASPEQSIWRDLSEDTFRQHLVDLEERTNAVPIDPRVFSPEKWSSQSSTSLKHAYTLPLHIEQQFTDDFACLAAVEEGAQSVAAACLEEHVQPVALKLRFAALDISLSDAVKTALQDLSEILVQAATDERGDLSPEAMYIDALFQRVVLLHSRRLLARLRSTKWEKPKHLAKSHKKPLWKDFENLIHRVQFLYTKREKLARQTVEKALQDLAFIYKEFESLESFSHDDASPLMQLVNASFAFCTREDVKDYAQRLERGAGAVPTKQISSAIKCLRQIEKIAAYRRMCISLVRTARHYPALFQNRLTMEYLPPYQSVPTSIGYEEWAKTCHVHAEVQLAVHYDLLAKDKLISFLPPRTIGISKWLCFLCYQFLKAHEQFFPSKTHGRLYDQWTVPDLMEFDDELTLRYRHILSVMDEEVRCQTENEPELWRIEPMTSRQDLLSTTATASDTDMVR